MGDKVSITSKVYFRYGLPVGGRTLKTIDSYSIKPVECIVLGYTHINEGVVVRNNSPEWYGGESYLERKKTVKVWVVQPVSKTGRYLKSFYTKQDM